MISVNIEKSSICCDAILMLLLLLLHDDVIIDDERQRSRALIGQDSVRGRKRRDVRGLEVTDGGPVTVTVGRFR